MVSFAKRALPIPDLARLLVSRGLAASSQSDVERIINVVGYYRLTGFLHAFRANDGTDNYLPGTSLEDIWSLYSFDRKLRGHMFDAVARIEVALRAAIVTEQTRLASSEPFLYVERSNFPQHNVKNFAKMLSYVCRAIDNAGKEPCIRHFMDNPDLRAVPVWALMEVVPFGTVTLYYEGLPFKIKKAVCDHFGVHPNAFIGWIMAIKKVRNICAHHARLWNRQIDARLSLKTSRDRRLANLNQCLTAQHSNSFTTLFEVASVCAYLLESVRPESKWRTRFKNLLSEYPNVDQGKMGFPANWKSFPLWQ